MPSDPLPNIEPPDMTAIPPRPWLPRMLIVFAVLLVLLAIFGLHLRYRPLPFDPARWQTSTGSTRGRMLNSLLEQTDFVGFTRVEVEVYLGKADFDDRLFWYDLGPDAGQVQIDPRADVGDPSRLYGIFQHDRGRLILEVLYNHRRPTLGSERFDSTGWFGDDPSVRRPMFLNALGRLRALGLTRDVIQGFLGPPDGYDDNDVVTSSGVTN
jgi:hypothetical protein